MNPFLPFFAILLAVLAGTFFLGRLRQQIRDLDTTVADLLDGADRTWDSHMKVMRTVELLLSATGGLWPTGRGQLMQIRDMTDAHISNALEYLKENPAPPSFLGAKDHLLKEQDRRHYGRKLGIPVQIGEAADQIEKAVGRRPNTIIFGEAAKTRFLARCAAQFLNTTKAPSRTPAEEVARYPAGSPFGPLPGTRLEYEVGLLVRMYDRAGKPGDYRHSIDGRIFENLRSALQDFREGVK